MDRVTFFLHGEPRLDALLLLDPDRSPGEFQTGERVWILQTYLRLKHAGYDVRLTDEWPTRGIVVFDALQRHALRRVAGSTRHLVLVGCRRDVRQPHIADFEVLQNGFGADEDRGFFIPHWSQPGLIARDPNRGTTIRRIVYKGFVHNLHPDFTSVQWTDFLAERGIGWTASSSEYHGPQRSTASVDWHDFRDADLALAVRPAGQRRRMQKPATKLYNAWRAGVPALLGPEHAYRELRRSGLDYLEIRDAADARTAVDQLIRDPTLFGQMVANGQRRGEEFSPGAVLARWVDVLFRQIPERVQAPRVRRWQGKPLWLKASVSRAAQWLGDRW